MKPFFGRDKGEIRVCKQGLQVVYMFKILISWQPFSTGRKEKKKRGEEEEEEEKKTHYIEPVTLTTSETVR